MASQNSLNVSKFKPEERNRSYRMSQDDQVKIAFLGKRENAMREARTAVDKDWDLYQTMIDAIFEPYPDERSSSTVPLSSAMIELFVAEAVKIKTEYNFRAENKKFYHNAKALEYTWNYDRRKNQRDIVFDNMEYITGAFGTSVLYVGHQSNKKKQKDPIFDEFGELDWEEREITDDKIIVSNVDIRKFYVDNHAISSIDEASDVVYKHIMSYEKFILYEKNPLYKNVKYVAPIQYSNDYDTFVTEEEYNKSGDFVEITYYWNVDKDIYMEVANGIIVREHPMISTINGTKALPFTIRVLGKKNYSIYGRGLCEGLLMFNSEVNNLRELLMDGIRRSNSQVLAIGNGLTFNGREFSYDNEILTFDGNLGANFHQISGNQPNSSIFNYIDRLYKDIAIYVGIDIQNIVGAPQQTAFQTEVQREASQKRINVWLRNRNLAYERFANLYKDALQIFFPRKTTEQLYPEIEIEGERYINGKFVKSKGKHMVSMTPEMLEGDMYVDVYTNTTAPTINMVDRQLKLELMQTVGIVAQGYAQAKQLGVDMDTILPLKQTLGDLASDYNISSVAKTDDEDVMEKKKEIATKLESMLAAQQEKPVEPNQQKIDKAIRQGEQQMPQQESPTLSPNASRGAGPRTSLF